MKLIDTHNHLYLEDFDPEQDQLVTIAKESGIDTLLLPNVDTSTIRRMHDLCDRYPDFAYPMMGLHPTSVDEHYAKNLKETESWLGKRVYCGIGEIGIDLYWDKTYLKEQKEVFEEQLRWSIDLNLPVGGSLDDPQFSVGGIVVKVIVNLIGKALTSPFALLGPIFRGNAEELAWLDFEPGFARLGPAADDKLKSIAKVMADKPGLKLEIAGRVDPATDREGLGRAMLLGKVEALKVKDMAKKGESLADDGRVTVSPAEYPALLTRVYKDEKFPKPRNVIGLAKELPVSEMEKLILANTKVGDEDVRLLGQQRAQAVKSWLLDKGQVPAERVFLLSTHEGDDGKQPKARVSRVDFSLR